MAFNDYPESAVNNAKRALKWADENGWGSCGTPVGKSRANSIAKREKLSLDTVKRVYSFLSRHAQNADVPYDEGCGGLMYDAWGGKSMLPWARKTINKMEEKNNNHEAELRAQYGEDVELRTAEVRAAGDDSLIVEGYASNFDVEYDLGYFKESVARGAFDDVLGDDVRFLLNHTGAPLARTTNGTLELTVDETGLRYRAALADTQDGRDLYKLIKRGDITQSSFAFTIDSDEWSEDRSTRTITKIGRLLDTSAVTYPASPSTTVAARNMAAAAQEAAELNDEQETQEPATEERAEPETIKTEARNFTPTTKNNFSNMTLNDLKGQRSAYYEEFVGIGQKADSEGRSLTEAEQERCDKLDSMVADLDVKIKHKQREQEMVARMAQSGTTSNAEQREVERVNNKFSLSRAIATVANGRALEGAEAEWSAEAQKEMRSRGLQTAGQVAIPTIALRAGAADDFQAGSGDGSGFVPTSVPAAIEALRAPSVIEQLGTTVIRNATGNLQFPRVSAKAVGTGEDEVSADAASTMEMDEVTLSPQRVAANTKYSKQLILQGGPEVDALIANELSAAMNAFIDDAAFDAILASSAINASTSGDTALNAALAFKMEGDVLADHGNLAGASYVMSPLAYQQSKSEAAVSNVSALWEGGNFNGYNAVATPYLVDGLLADASTAAGQMLFGNFAQGALLAFFSGIDLLIDPYSNAGTAQIALHVNRFYDFDIRQPGALAKATQLT
ncbi:MAG: HK97 family phage prohead protease [Marivivens sp.]|nr:HK97 family phage prohead protease [Marivivens sp.]